MIKLSTKKGNASEIVEIKDFSKNGDKIEVEFTNKSGEKRFYTIVVTAKEKITMI